MVKKYVYAGEDFARVLRIMLGVEIPLAAVCIVLFVLGADVAALCVSILWLVLLAALGIPLRTVASRRKRHDAMVQGGVRVAGKVVEIRSDYGATDSVDAPSSASHYLIVTYTAPDGTVRSHQTPALAFCPEQRDDITCDVYLHGREVLATHFQNLYKAKTDWLFILFCVVVSAALVGILYLVN